MISRHSEKEGVSVRTGSEIRGAANAVLEAHNWTMAQFIIAALRAVAADPAPVLALLATHRPEPKPRGRPRRAAE